MTSFPPKKVDEAWQFASKHITEACRHGAYSVEQVEEKVLSGEWMVWTGEKSAITTEVFSNDIGLCLTITHAGGDLRELLRMYDDIEGFARESGCVKMYISGRPGWKKIFSGRGYIDENLIGKRL